MYSLEELQRNTDEVLSIANSEYLDKSPLTRSLVPGVKEVIPYGKAMSTRSTNGEENIFYIVNYIDDQGFVVVSSDKRATPVYALSYEGNFAIQDTAIYDALKDFLIRAEQYFTEEISQKPEDKVSDISTRAYSMAKKVHC